LREWAGENGLGVVGEFRSFLFFSLPTHLHCLIMVGLLVRMKNCR
jgi:hypothetical protein